MVTQNFQLIDGTYAPSDARDLLVALVKSNINCCKIQSLSLQEKGESDNTQPLEQIESLKCMEASIRRLIQAASIQGLQLQISGNIEITAVSEETEVHYSRLSAFV